MGEEAKPAKCPILKLTLELLLVQLKFRRRQGRANQTEDQGRGPGEIHYETEEMHS